MKKPAEYKQDYVKFFCQRSDLHRYDNFDVIKKDTLADRRVSSIIAELQQWPCYEIQNHKNVDHPIHKLSFLAELGFNVSDPGIDGIVERVMAHQSAEGPFNILINIPRRFGGTGNAELSWVMSDAPVVIYSATKLNNGIDVNIRRAIDFIAEGVSSNGWRCFASPVLGRFRGPGKKEDPCPYANMFSLKMLGLTGPGEYKKEKTIGIETVFDLWRRQKETKPYLFGIGTDFRKLKLPFVWYDILNMVDTLSLYREVHAEKIFQEMLAIIMDKEREGGFVPESIYMKAREWDFGQKKEPSEYMNAIIDRITKRLAVKE